jgi:hypothetical protein
MNGKTDTKPLSSLDGATSQSSAPGIPVFRGGDRPVMNPGASSSFDSDVVIQHFMK